MTEEAFKAWKDQTRQEALEKEVKRLRERTYRQSGKIGSLQRAIYFTWFFFIVLFVVMISKGMISIGKKKAVPAKTVMQAAISKTTKSNVVPDTLPKKEQISIPEVPVPLKNTTGVIYCVQIGAFTDLNLDEFKDNLISLQQDSYNGINQITLGRFRDYDKTVRFLDIVQQIGFQDAFIMSFRNGKRVPLGDLESVKHKIHTEKDTSVSITIPYVVPEEEPLTDTISTTGNNL
jgi:hypothetical protein